MRLHEFKKRGGKWVKRRFGDGKWEKESGKWEKR